MKLLLLLAALAVLSTLADGANRYAEIAAEREARSVRHDLDYPLEELRSDVRRNEDAIDDLERRSRYGY